MNEITRPRLWDFLAPFCVLLPAAYFVWTVLSPWLLAPVVFLSDAISQWLFSGYVKQVVQAGVFLVIVVVREASEGATAIQVNGVDLKALSAFRVYAPPLGSGMPLFIALALASDASPRRHVVNLGVGIAALFLGQTISVLFKIAATLFSKIPEFRPSDALCSVDCYWSVLYPLQYFTYLILPTMLPVLLWGILYAAYLRALVPALGAKGLPVCR